MMATPNIPNFGDGELVETTDEEGVIHYFEKLEEFEMEGQQYALLIYHGTEEDLKNAEKNGHEGCTHDHDHEHAHGHTHGPAAEGDDDDEEAVDEEIILMRMVNDGESFVYEHIEDDAEFEKVVEYLEKVDAEMGDDDEDEDETEKA